MALASEIKMLLARGTFGKVCKIQIISSNMFDCCREIIFGCGKILYNITPLLRNKRTSYVFVHQFENKSYFIIDENSLTRITILSIPVFEVILGKLSTFISRYNIIISNVSIYILPFIDSLYARICCS